MEIAVDDPRRADIIALIEEHLADMRTWSPPGHSFALDLDGLTAPSVTFFSARDQDGRLLGIAAIKDFGDGSGELKSMRTPRSSRRTGAGRALLERVVSEATARGWSVLYLETGSQPEFEPARTLYASRGFQPTGAFGDYAPSEYSAFFRLELPATA